MCVFKIVEVVFHAIYSPSKKQDVFGSLSVSPLALVYTCAVTRRGSVIAIGIDFSRHPVDIHPDRGAAPRSGISINWSLGGSLSAAY